MRGTPAGIGSLYHEVVEVALDEARLVEAKSALGHARVEHVPRQRVVMKTGLPCHAPSDRCLVGTWGWPGQAVDQERRCV